jgi:DNA-binding MarR family transcriptional regulator
VRPTPAGRRAARKIADTFAAVDAKLAQETTVRERRSFQSVLGKLEELL